jgi:lincosamide nucleotidyltransferase A/C/D/E
VGTGAPGAFDDSGAGRQAGLNGTHFDYPPKAFTTGTLNRRLIGCLSIQQQLDFHTGYAAGLERRSGSCSPS